jgi:F-type H+-transporting ATPase subunit delta
MTLGSIARRYATALFTIGEENNNLLGVLKNVQSLAEAFEVSDEIREVLANPLIRMDTRRGILKEIAARLGVQEVVRNFLNLLFDKSRIDMLPDIARELNALTDEKLGRVRAEVTSAVALDDEVVASLKSALERITGKAVVMRTREDPRLLGGMVTRVKDVMFDGSLRHYLDTLRENMRGRA